MPMLVAGLLLLWLSSILLRGMARGDPAVIARIVRQGGGSVALVLAVVLIFRGQFNLALLAAGAGLGLLNMTGKGDALNTGAAGWAFTKRTRARSARMTRYRTDGLEMLVDEATGATEGAFTAGPAARREFASLSRSECAASYRWCLGSDPRGATLFEAYLDRRFAGWREAAEFGHDPGGTHPGRRTAREVRMPDHEAYHVLGLAEGASREEITRAHRHLMKRCHPDHGGSTATAARVNEAKDVLMRRHP